MADLPTEIDVVHPIVEEPEDFFTICPRDSKFGQYNIQPIKLKVIQSKGVEVTPQANMKVNDFNKGYSQIVNNNGDNDRFKIDIILHKDETVTGHQHISIHSKGVDPSLLIDLSYAVMDDGIQKNEVNLFLPTEDVDYEEDWYDVHPLTYVLNYWFKTATPLMVVTQAIDITDGLYVIIANGSRKQTYHEHTIWTLEFFKYEAWKLGKYKNDNKIVKQALSKAKKKKTTTSSKKKTDKAKMTVKEADKYRAKLKKCDYKKKLVYSKKKKSVYCVKIMQQLLNYYTGSNLKIDGWFGNTTVDAVKKFQKRYKDKYGLKETGKVNYATWRALFKGGSPTVKVKTITLDAPKMPTGIIKSK